MDLLIEANGLVQEEKYDEAMELYASIDENDTNYVLMLTEKSAALLYADRNEEAAAAARLALDHPEDMIPEIYMNLGTALNRLEKFDEAKEMYVEALQYFPSNRKILYNKSLVYLGEEDLEGFYEALKEVLTINPFHPASHFRLGMLAAAEGKTTQAMLSFLTFLMFEPETDRALDVLTFADNMVSKERDYSNAKGLKVFDEKGFSQLDVLIENQVAMTNKYKVPFKHEFPFVKNSYLILEKLKYNPKSDGFWMQFYVPFYKLVLEEKLFEDLMGLVTISSPNEDLQKDAMKNINDIKKFVSWKTNQWFTLHQSHESAMVQGEAIACTFFYEDIKWLQAKGNFSKDEKMIGKWEIFHENGSLESEQIYDDKGVEQGQWTFYYDNGRKKTVQNFKDGLTHGPFTLYYRDGTLKRTGNYADDELEGLVTFYNSLGVKTRTEEYSKGELNGAYITYYPNGQQEYVLNYVNGKVEGNITQYHPNGAIASEISTKDDERSGPFKRYFLNGQLASETMYEAGERNGSYKSFYRNGNLSEEGNYKDDNAIGNYRSYRYDGERLIEEHNYDESGKLNGMKKQYDTDGVLHYEWEYSKGEITAYTYYDKQGNVIVSNKRKLTKFPFIGYTPLGNKRFEGDYEGSEKNGMWKYYNADGVLISTEMYKNGSLNGEDIGFHLDGSKRSALNYVDGLAEGQFLEYNIHGQLVEQITYVSDQKQGAYYTYGPQGNAVQTSYFVDDVRDGLTWYFDVNEKPFEGRYYKEGLLEGYVVCDTNGVVQEKVWFDQGNGYLTYNHPNGDIRYKAQIKGGVFDGPVQWFYFDNKVKTQGAYLDDNRHGEWISYDVFGNVTDKFSYEYGTPIGQWVDYFITGQEEWVRNYQNGELHGEYVWYYPNGNKELEGEYKEGKRQGDFTYYDAQGNVQCKRKYHNGQMVSYTYQGKDGEYVKPIAIKQGNVKFKSYFPNGKVSMEFTMENGLFMDSYTKYNSNGKVVEKNDNLKGDNHGFSRSYYADGTLRVEKEYAYDEKHGYTKYFYPNGKLQQSLPFKYGYLHGWAEMYDENGKLVLSILYYDGRIVSVKKA